LAEIHLRDRALSTSGSRTQSFYHQGRRYGHILDPRTGWPADGVLSATALAPSAAMADALSTAFYVMGAHQSLAFCERNPEVGLLMVSPAERSGSIEVNVIGLDDDEWQLLDS
ncbi:MAG: FAD:protein FMN transferase, partial [Planctomycetes bacterium]|nr:FAD:protein FMN transferase [Planctomycetota bacterium]